MDLGASTGACAIFDFEIMILINALSCKFNSVPSTIPSIMPYALSEKYPGKAGFPNPGELGCRGILIDLDNTLYAYDPAHEAALKKTHPVSPLALSFEDFAFQYKQARDRVTERLTPQASCRSRLLAFQMLCEAWRVPCPYEKALELDRAYWHHFIEAMELDPEAGRFLDLCSRQGLPVCIVSDLTTEVQIRKIVRLGLQEKINYLVTSEETGKEKPDPVMFQTALSKMNLKAKECVMLGDNPDKDIKGAEALGIKAFLIRLSGKDYP